MKDSSESSGPGSVGSDTPRGLSRAVLIWSYERGTLQYDVICALILAFVFLVPRSCFEPRPARGAGAESATTQPKDSPASGAVVKSR